MSTLTGRFFLLYWKFLFENCSKLEVTMKLVMGGPRAKLKFDPDHELDYGYWRCRTCEAQFYGGGGALHNKDCVETGYSESCDYHVGASHIRKAFELGAESGDNDQCSHGISANAVLEDLPGVAVMLGLIPATQDNGADEMAAIFDQPL